MVITVTEDGQYLGSQVPTWEQVSASTLRPCWGGGVIFRMLNQHRKSGEHGQIGPTTLSNPHPTPPAIRKYLVLLCPGYDPKTALGLTGALERAQPARRTHPCSPLCDFLFQFSLLSFLTDPDPGECADYPGAARPTGWFWDAERGPFM